MLFSRRDKLSLRQKIRHWIWPRKSWKRSWHYILYRVARLSGTPHQLALGFAAGVFASFTPFVGFHFIIGFFISFATRSSMLASAFGTFVGNPFTFGPIWFTSYISGVFILNNLLGLDYQYSGFKFNASELHFLRLFSEPSALWNDFVIQIKPVFMPMLCGGIPLGIIFGAIFYFPIKAVLSEYKSKGVAKLKSIVEHDIAEEKAEAKAKLVENNKKVK